MAQIDVAPSAGRRGELKLQAGMPAEVFIRTDSRTAFDYLLAPVTAYLRRAMREPVLMRLLFVHQNFPGQYRHLAAHYAGAGHEVVALGEKENLARTSRGFPGVKLFGYEAAARTTTQAPSKRRVAARHAARPRASPPPPRALRRAGFRPDLVFAHIGWGEALFLKDIFPEAPRPPLLRVLLPCARRRHGLRSRVSGPRRRASCACG